MTVGPSKFGLCERLRVCRGGSRNQLRGLKKGGSAMRGAMLCLPADLTPTPFQRFNGLPLGFENGREREREGGAGAPRRTGRLNRGGEPLVVMPLVSTSMSAAAPGKTKRIVTTATHNGSIAVAGAQVSSTPSVSRVVLLSHTSRCGGRGRGGARSAARRGVRRVSEWAKALGFEVISPAS